MTKERSITLSYHCFMEIWKGCLKNYDEGSETEERKQTLGES